MGAIAWPRTVHVGPCCNTDEPTDLFARTHGAQIGSLVHVRKKRPRQLPNVKATAKRASHVQIHSAFGGLVLLVALSRSWA